MDTDLLELIMCPNVRVRRAQAAHKRKMVVYRGGNRNPKAGPLNYVFVRAICVTFFCLNLVDLIQNSKL